MATADPTAPTRAQRSLDLPAVIAGDVDLLKLSEALTRAGLCGRYDGARELVIIEPAVPAPVIPFPSRRAADPVAENARAGIAWFNGLTPAERRYWLEAADSAVPADAWRAFQSGVQP